MIAGRCCGIRDDCQALLGNDPHRCDKLIPPPRQGNDIAVVAGLLIECPPHHGDALREAVLVYISIWPDILSQFVPGEGPSGFCAKHTSTSKAR
jgi:hypothetical protein